MLNSFPFSGVSGSCEGVSSTSIYISLLLGAMLVKTVLPMSKLCNSRVCKLPKSRMQSCRCRVARGIPYRTRQDLKGLNTSASATKVALPPRLRLSPQLFHLANHDQSNHTSLGRWHIVSTSTIALLFGGEIETFYHFAYSELCVLASSTSEKTLRRSLWIRSTIQGCVTCS